MYTHSKLSLFLLVLALVSLGLPACGGDESGGSGTTAASGGDAQGSTDSPDAKGSTTSADGSDGADGKDGTDGKDTADGSDGKDSTDGSDATDGGATIEISSCTSDSDCEPGVCIASHGGSVCSVSCNGKCPKGYQCKTVSLPEVGAATVCVPDDLSVCFPCHTDQDCVNVDGGLVPYDGAVCIPSDDGSGSFCGGGCEDDDGCPTGYKCSDVKVGDADKKQCVPAEGVCECSSLSEGLSTSCSVKNDHGTCTGDRQCIEGKLGDCSAAPAEPEVCDGKDNNCSGAIDDNIESVAADKTEGVCAGAVKVCAGEGGAVEPDYTEIEGYAVIDDSCDGKDNNCDGVVDDAVAAPLSDNQNGVCAGAVKVCNGDSGFAEPDYAAIEGYEATETLCDGKDNDCDGSVDEADDLKPPVADKTKGVCENLVKVCDGVNGWAEPDYAALENYEDDEALCDGKDNDCDGDTDEKFAKGGDVQFTDADGSSLSVGDACGVGSCTGGTVKCNSTNDGLVCDSAGKGSADICDGVDNDCDPNTPDGAADAGVGTKCDGDDTDLCNDGTTICKDGKIVCDDAENKIPDLCDGVDNDCDEKTADGSGEPTLGNACDGDDQDKCELGKIVCKDGQLTCEDLVGNQLEICDGKDNDCNSDTLDGADEKTLGNKCDSDGDADLCEEGKIVCLEGKLACDDPGEENVELCDGKDNDCNFATKDGSQDPKINQKCDGDDKDLCEEGVTICKYGGTIACNDFSKDNPDICDGKDNDCNDKTADGSDDKELNTPCDGDDTDLCADGATVCDAGKLVCNDDAESIVDVCDGKDNDCNADTIDGSGDPKHSKPCDGEDADLCADGIWSCSKAGALVCSDDAKTHPELCDGKDNDCNEKTVDGADEVTFGKPCDGENDADLCEEGKIVCTAGAMKCDDPGEPSLDICDGQDNDCDESTVDGVHDKQLGQECDGDDADLCKEGELICLKGKISCNDTNTKNPEICDGKDNDCDESTPDGSEDAQIGQACDGDDPDTCLEGKYECVPGKGLTCSDPNDYDPDLCDGIDNDCNSGTPDGYDEPTLGSNCDGKDTDLCKEGNWICVAKKMVCDDDTPHNQEICDGKDNDCNSKTKDGDEDALFNVKCDGDAKEGGDADLCKEGIWVCTQQSVDKAIMTCNDPNTENPEICNGKDDDCNKATSDFAHDPKVKGSTNHSQKDHRCDTSQDSDKCAEGWYNCKSGQYVCEDNSGNKNGAVFANKGGLDICDGIDNDCNSATLDGSTGPSSYPQSCSNNKTISMTKSGTKSLSGGFNNITGQDWVRVTFPAPATKNGGRWHPRINLSPSDYKMRVQKDCKGNLCTPCNNNVTTTKVQSWSMDAKWGSSCSTGNNGKCKNNNTLFTTVYVKIYREKATSGTCKGWTLKVDF